MAEMDAQTAGGDEMDVDAPEKKSTMKAKPSRGYEITSKTIKTPPFSYACLELISSLTSSTSGSLSNSVPAGSNATSSALDELTARSYLTSALTQFLGLTGSSISIDILKIEGLKAWIRVPREDLAPVLAATGGWVGRGQGVDERVGWRVRGSGNWLSRLVASVDEGRVWKD